MGRSRQQNTIIPDLPREDKLLNENNELTEHWKLFFDQLITALQGNFKTEGIILPRLDAYQIGIIQGVYTPLIGAPLPPGVPDITGQSITDITNRVPKVFIITYDGSTPPNIATASWKTYTIT